MTYKNRGRYLPSLFILSKKATSLTNSLVINMKFSCCMFLFCVEDCDIYSVRGWREDEPTQQLVETTTSVIGHLTTEVPKIDKYLWELSFLNPRVMTLLSHYHTIMRKHRHTHIHEPSFSQRELSVCNFHLICHQVIFRFDIWCTYNNAMNHFTFVHPSGEHHTCPSLPQSILHTVPFNEFELRKLRLKDSFRFIF
jgi:hypothetical protein